MTAFSDYCIYTIRDGEDLACAARKGGQAKFTQRRAWVTGLRLWLEAQQVRKAMPVVLGDATDCSRLLYWGVLSAVELGDRKTTFTVKCLRRFPESHKPQELVLRSTGRPIGAKFIRPYAICRTPSFLQESRSDATRPRVRTKKA